MPSPRRPARLHLAWLTFLASAGVLALLVALLAADRFPWFGSRPRPLLVYCAAGLKAPVEAVAREYQQEYGVEIQLQYGGSNTLLAALAVSNRGDLYIPADGSYVDSARKKGLIQEVIPSRHMKPTLAVRQGNPKKIRSLDDLIQRKLRISQANPEAAAVGKLAQEVLESKRLWRKFQQGIVVTKPTVNDVANDIQVGAVDAGVVWDVTVRQVPGIESVPDPVFAGVAASLSVCVAEKTSQPSEALRFARYLSARDKGLKIFAREGFSPVDGDLWSETPELHLYAGAMLRPAIKKTLIDFEKREGVKVLTIYNGCGNLVAAMKTSKLSPDAFFACDREFLDMVQDRFGPPDTISGNQLVIVVHKGNPHDIARLKDLAKPGLHVGIGHEKQCAMGVLTQQTLKQDRSHGAVMKNVKVQSPTGDMLVNQMLTGSLDAVIAYISNAAGHPDKFQAIAIDIPCAFANQPFAIGKSSDFKVLTARLLDALLTEESRQRFQEYGFTWKAKRGANKR